jgi:parallel beta-helix repeat protein
MQKNLQLRKCLATGIILLFVGSCINPAIAQNTEKPLPTSRGDWLYVGGSDPGNYTKIQDAIDNASKGDTVFVFDDSSPYYENIVINKTINLIGEDKETTIIDGGGIKYVISVLADSVNITGFWVQNSIWPYAGFDIYSTKNTIYENYISNHEFSGISVRNSSNLISRNDIFDNYNNGIYALFNSNITISENVFLNNKGCIYFQETSDSKICNNYYLNNQNCVLIGFGLNNNIYSNFIEGSSDSCIYLVDSQYTNIYTNVINNTHDPQVIRIQKSSENCIYNNTISNNSGISIEVFESSNNNSFYHNNFINNFQNAYDECVNHWDNGYPSGGNYWDTYIGDDVFWGLNQEMNGSDGIGDTPYDISGSDSKDMYPLMEPYGMTTLSLDFRGGLFKWSGIIKNIGNNTAFNVQWKIIIDGGIVLLGRESSGTIPKPLHPGEETQVSSNFILGFGKIIITIAVWADNAPYVSKSTPGTLFLFFIKI